MSNLFILVYNQQHRQQNSAAEQLLLLLSLIDDVIDTSSEKWWYSILRNQKYFEICKLFWTRPRLINKMMIGLTYYICNIWHPFYITNNNFFIWLRKRVKKILLSMNFEMSNNRTRVKVCVCKAVAPPA